MDGGGIGWVYGVDCDGSGCSCGCSSDVPRARKARA